MKKGTDMAPNGLMFPKSLGDLAKSPGDLAKSLGDLRKNT